MHLHLLLHTHYHCQLLLSIPTPSTTTTTCLHNPGIPNLAMYILMIVAITHHLPTPTPATIVRPFPMHLP
jgi:hypothetical protein